VAVVAGAAARVAMFLAIVQRYPVLPGPGAPSYWAWFLVLDQRRAATSR
jgi:hypothetical protein